MNDDRGDTAQRYRSMFMKVDPVDRLKLGCRMFSTSMKLVSAGVRSEIGDTAGENERRRRILFRLYSGDLSREQMEDFLSRTRRT
jgi:hypothetical protein